MTRMLSFSFFTLKNYGLVIFFFIFNSILAIENLDILFIVHFFVGQDRIKFQNFMNSIFLKPMVSIKKNSGVFTTFYLVLCFFAVCLDFYCLFSFWFIYRNERMCFAQADGVDFDESAKNTSW